MCPCLQAYADVQHREGICGTLQLDVSALLTVPMHRGCMFASATVCDVVLVLFLALLVLLQAHVRCPASIKQGS